VRFKATDVLLGAWSYLLIFLIYAPFFLMLILSFQGPSGTPTFPMQGGSLYWYKKVFHITATAQELAKAADEGTALGSYVPTLLRSLLIGSLTAIISTLLGAMAAMGFRRRFRGAGFVFYLFLSGLITPGVCVGLGLAMFIQKMGFTLSWYTTGLLGHVIWTLPFTFLIMLMSFNRFDVTVEEAASVLGASPWTVFRTVTFPIIKPGVAVSFLFGFTLSFDELIRTVFLAGSENTLPLFLMASLTVRVTPMLYALGSLITIFSLILVIGSLLYATRKRAIV
jgi:putative spermidine/putrescine transport system permease protein